MSAILEQLELNQTVFFQFAIFAVLFLFLSNIYFKPFLKLFQTRHKKTVSDREAAEKMIAEAQSKFEEYKQRLAAERAAARGEYDAILEQAKKEESRLLAHARDEAKKITQEAADSVAQQQAQLKKQLQADIEGIAQSISEKLLSRKV